MARDMRELGRLGGQATARTHDHEHYVALGKKGFGRLAQKYTSRSFALKILGRKGKVAPHRPPPADMGPDQLRLLASAVGLDGYADHLPF